jgi:tRNA threonylcarbamoyladenosine biosynthesis protein TsaE
VTIGEHETATAIESEAILELVTASPEQTAAVGANVARWLANGDVVLLHGDLGAGKTTLAKGIAAALGIDAVVSSPSFTLVNDYDADPTSKVRRLFHLDLYRLRGEDELDSIGFADFVSAPDGVTLVEWPERALGLLPDRYLLIELMSAGADRRRLRITPFPPDDSWQCMLDDLRDRIATDSLVAERQTKRIGIVIRNPRSPWPCPTPEKPSGRTF